MIGLIGADGGSLIDNVTIRADLDNDGNYTDSNELIHVDDFALSSGYREETLTYDAAGNLTYDGVNTYAYDAWNRLVEVYKDNHDASDNPLIATMAYDALGRRVSKAITNLADFDGTYHYYYDGQRYIEIRNGSSQVLKQHVWGLQYIDELVQVALNQDPQNATAGIYQENDCERFFWALNDANYNVLGLVNKYGTLVERYEYTPYGQRQVYSHGWIIADTDDDGDVDLNDWGNFSTDYGTTNAYSRGDVDGDGDVDLSDQGQFVGWYGTTKLSDVDPLVLYPRSNSFRTGYSWGASGEPLCEVGHQGLMHDEEFGLVYNRARMLHPTLGRFVQRDPLGYVDGMNGYICRNSSPTSKTDPFGLRWAEDDREPGTDINGNPYPPPVYIPIPDEPGPGDQWNPWNFRGSNGVKDYRAYFEQRFPKTIKGAKQLLASRIEDFACKERFGRSLRLLTISMIRTSTLLHT